MAATPDQEAKRDAAARLLMIFPGPIYDPEEFFTERLEEKSAWYRGVVLTSGPEPRTLRVGGFDVVVLPEGGRFKGAEVVAFLRAARRAIQAERVDAVVTYDPLKSGLVGLCAARLARAPLIVELNGDYTASANYADIPSPIVRGIKQRLFVRLARFITRRAHGIKLLYPTQIEPFRTCLRNPVIRTFPDFVGWNGFRDLGEEPEVLFAGFPFYLKGVDVLIAAFKSVSDECPDWRLKILGWFPDMRPLETAIGGHPRIVVHPPVYRREMPKHMGRCGIFVLPSRTEAMGRVLVEAMLCGKPRIGTKVGGIPEVIRHEEDGLLVASEDVGELAQALRRLMRDASLRRQLGVRGRERAEREFATAPYMAHVRQLYDSVLEGKRRSVAPTLARLSAWIGSVSALPELYQPGLML